MKQFKYSLLAFLLILFFQKEVGAQCQAGFSYINTGNTFNFTSGWSGVMPSFSWNFGDGNTGTGASTSNTYTTNGIYKVTLIIQKPGCIDSAIHWIAVNGGTCPVTAGIYTDGSNSFIKQFNFSGTGDNPTTRYLWYFGDGQTSPVQDPTHSYSSADYNHVSLIATDTSGCSSSAAAAVSICMILANFDDSIVGLSHYLTSTSITPSATATYNWDFGDGNFGTGQTTNHTYAVAGNYRITLSVNDGACFDSTSKPASCNLKAGFTWLQTSCNSYAFNSSQSTGTTPGVTYSWSFGDGVTDTAINPFHTYTSNGRYNVFLLLTDSGGCSDIVTDSINVNVMNAAFTYTTNQLTSNFTSTTTGNSINSTYNWDFGDGNFDVGQSTSHTYSSNGNYLVKLTVIDSVNSFVCLDTFTQLISVQNTPCTFNTSFSDSINGTNVTFQSTTVGVSTTATYAWDFGDGNNGAGQQVSHTYNSQGLFNVKLVISDSTCQDSATRLISITANVFTPNGDGIDDVFSIPCGSAGGLVYNRFGTLVKTLAPGSLVWDGSNNSSGLEPTGLYFIICNGSATPISVTLIR